MQLRAWLAGSAEDCRAWRLRVSVSSALRVDSETAFSADDALLAVRSLSVDAPDLRQHAPAGDDEDESEAGVDDVVLGLVALRLPPHASLLGLDFEVYPMDEQGADRVGRDPGLVPAKRGAVTIVHNAHTNAEAAR